MSSSTPATSLDTGAHCRGAVDKTPLLPCALCCDVPWEGLSVSSLRGTLAAITPAERSSDAIDDELRVLCDARPDGAADAGPRECCVGVADCCVCDVVLLTAAVPGLDGVLDGGR